jgi:hypothetical protein
MSYRVKGGRRVDRARPSRDEIGARSVCAQANFAFRSQSTLRGPLVIFRAPQPGDSGLEAIHIVAELIDTGNEFIRFGP